MEKLSGHQPSFGHGGRGNNGGYGSQRKGAKPALLNPALFGDLLVHERRIACSIHIARQEVPQRLTSILLSKVTVLSSFSVPSPPLARVGSMNTSVPTMAISPTTRRNRASVHRRHRCNHSQRWIGGVLMCRWTLSELVFLRAVGIEIDGEVFRSVREYENTHLDIGPCHCGAKTFEQHKPDCRHATVLTLANWYETIKRYDCRSEAIASPRLLTTWAREIVVTASSPSLHAGLGHRCIGRARHFREGDIDQGRVSRPLSEFSRRPDRRWLPCQS